jgi:murein DD-endopeptidase MepM/ murein hydrolase activator NlpD
MLMALLAAPSPAAAATSAAELARQIKALDGRLTVAGHSYRLAADRLDDTDYRLGAVKRKLGVTGKQLNAAEVALRTRAAYMYRTGGLDYLELLLSSQNLDELVARMEYVRRVSESDAVVIGRVKTLRRQLRSQSATLAAERRRRAEDVAARSRRKAEIEASLASVQHKYKVLKAQLAAAVAREMAATGHSSWAPPVGPNGMVFPVAGPNYYSDTWGAPRSGGRTHKGTDIMASRGTPCVAMLSGTVSSKEGGLGGKVIWLHADNGWSFYYAHLNGWAVRSGRVRAGETIAYVGNTGNAAGGACHLHFQIHPGGGGPVDPYPYLRACQ